MIDIKELEILAGFGLSKAQEGYWNEIWDSLIEYALSQEVKPISLEDLAKKLRDIFRFSQLPQPILLDHLEKLSSKNRVIKSNLNDGDGFALSSREHDIIKKRISIAEAKYSDLLNLIVSRMRNHVLRMDLNEEASIRELFNTFVSKSILSQSLDILKQIPLLIRKTRHTIRTSKTQALINDRLPEEHARIFTSVLLDITKEPLFQEYLWSAIQNYVCLEILRVDPRIEDLKTYLLDNSAVFIDSNVLLDLLLPSRGNAHAIAIAGCEYMKYHKISMFVSTLSLTEIRDLLHYGESLFMHVGEEANNPFVRDYAAIESATTSDPATRWYRYARTFSEPVLEGRLLSEYGVNTQAIPIQRFISSSQYDLFYMLVEEAWRKANPNKPGKREASVFHDVIHMLYIRQLRRRNKHRSVWFITRDYSLCLLAQALRASISEAPLAVASKTWLSLLSLFPMPSASAANKSVSEVMIDFMSSEWAQAFPEPQEGLSGIMANAQFEFGSEESLSNALREVKRKFLSEWVSISEEPIVEYQLMLNGLQTLFIRELSQQLDTKRRHWLWIGIVVSCAIMTGTAISILLHALFLPALYSYLLLGSSLTVLLVTLMKDNFMRFKKYRLLRRLKSIRGRREL